MKGRPGFTLIELLVTLAIMGILAASVLPLSELSKRRAQEKELREALWQMRSALDAYKKAVDEGRVARGADQSGYPPSLAALVDGVPDAKSPSDAQLRFLRRIPRDPLAEDDTATPSDKTWGERSYESAADAPKRGKDVFDVYTLSDKTGINGIPYREW